FENGNRKMDNLTKDSVDGVSKMHHNRPPISKQQNESDGGDFSIDKIDLDRIRIPRASIQAEKIKSPSKEDLKNRQMEVNGGDKVKCDTSKTNSQSETCNSTTRQQSNESTSSVIVVDSREGSI